MSQLFEPKGGTTKTTTATTTPSSAAQTLQNYAVSGAANVLGPNLYANSYTTAPINSDQTGAYDLTRLLASNAFDPTKAISVPQATTSTSGMGANSLSYAPASVGNAVNYTPATIGNASTYDAAQVGSGDIQAALNPYLSNVADTTMNSLRKAYAQNSAGIGARAAAAGSFGGSQEAIERSQADKDYGDQVSSTIAQLQSAGFDKATSTALANAQMRQSAAASNAGAQNNVMATDAAARNSAMLYASQAQNANRTQDANALTQAWSKNADAQNARDQFLASYGLQANNQNFNQQSTAAQLRSALKSNDFSQQLQAISALLGTGNAQQTYYQNNLNVPLQSLQALAGMTPQNYGGTETSTAPNTANSPFMNLLGLGVSALGTNVGGGTTLLGSLLAKK